MISGNEMFAKSRIILQDDEMGEIFSMNRAILFSRETCDAHWLSAP